jgi:hypothetical protein
MRTLDHRFGRNAMGDIVACPVKSAGLAPADIPFVPLSLWLVRGCAVVSRLLLDMALL